MSIPRRQDEAFALWARSTALDAAARVASAWTDGSDRSDVAAAYTLRLAERFEQYLRSGRIDSRP